MTEMNIDSTGNTTFVELIKEDNPLFIPRPIGASKLANMGTHYQFRYPPEYVDSDRSASYDSPTYPWLKLLSKYRTRDHPGFDVINFTMPSRLPFGRYILHYHWSGYMDCMDIDYVDHQVEHIYGVPPTTNRWTRVDHCIIPTPAYAGPMRGPEEFTDDIEVCKAKCIGDEACAFVQASPLSFPQAYQGFSGPTDQTKWRFKDFPGNEIVFPYDKSGGVTGWWNDYNVSDRLLTPENKNKLFCWNMQSGFSDKTFTKDEFLVSKDPDDPVFYSTCWLRNRDNIFPGYEDDAQRSIEVQFKFNEKCISCEDKASFENLKSVPVWQLKDTCVDCERDPSPPRPYTTILPPTTKYLVGENILCDGVAYVGTDPAYHYNGHQSCPTLEEGLTCIKKVNTLVNPQAQGGLPISQIGLEDCTRMVLADPECSETYMWLKDWSPINDTCACLRKNKPCCNGCTKVVVVPEHPWKWGIYQTTNTPDAACANGVLSADKSFCCTSQCSECRVNPQREFPFEMGPGMCDNYNVHVNRTCSLYNSPCYMK